MFPPPLFICFEVWGGGGEDLLAGYSINNIILGYLYVQVQI